MDFSISMFYGILIRMYHNNHNPPHIHTLYGDETVCCDFEGNVIIDALSKNKIN